MKQLKITINGEVKTFDLPENGEYKCEVTDSYVPKEGDCVMVELTDYSSLYWCKVTDTTTTFIDFKLSVNSESVISKNGCFEKSDNRIYTKITPEELKAKYAEAGYDWDYETDTIKPIKWIPKEGDEVWFLNAHIEPEKFTFIENVNFDIILLEKGLLFQTEEECQKFADHCWEFINKKNS